MNRQRDADGWRMPAMARETEKEAGAESREPWHQAKGRKPRAEARGKDETHSSSFPTVLLSFIWDEASPEDEFRDESVALKWCVQ